MAGLTAASRPVTGAGRGGTGGERRPPAGGRWGDIRGRSAAGHRIHRAPKTAGTGCCSVRLGAIRDGTGSGRDRPRSAPGMLRRPPARPPRGKRLPVAAGLFLHMGRTGRGVRGDEPIGPGTAGPRDTPPPQPPGPGPGPPPGRRCPVPVPVPVCPARSAPGTVKGHQRFLAKVGAGGGTLPKEGWKNLLSRPPPTKRQACWDTGLPHGEKSSTSRALSES